MLESIINPKRGERHPWQLLFVGFVYAVVSVLLANWIFSGNNVFEKHISIISVFFTVMFSIPFVYYTMLYEEKKDTLIKGERKLLKEHSRALLAFIFLFLGYVLAFSLLYILLPHEVENNFAIQIETYCQINSYGDNQFNDCVTGYLNKVDSGNVKFTGKNISNFDTLKNIFLNNLYVMILTIIFSLFFGAGAIFILAWNASVIGAAVGIFAKSLSGLPSGFLRFLFHGIPEILAYFIGGLAGGIIGFAIIKKDLEKEKFTRILEDFAVLLVLGVLVLIFAAVLEVYVTPIFFY